MISRHIDFEGMSNVRDLGGMTGADGKKIKNGLLFRSDQLHNATKADQEKLKEIGVKYIVDLRNSGKPEGSVPKGFLSGYTGMISVPSGKQGTIRQRCI